MADKKISDLNEVTSPNSSDVLPIVNSGETKKITVANLASSLVSTAVEVPTGDVDDSNTDFVFTKAPILVNVNGVFYRENNGWTIVGLIVTLAFPAGTGGDVYGLV